MKDVLFFKQFYARCWAEYEAETEDCIFEQTEKHMEAMCVFALRPPFWCGSGKLGPQWCPVTLFGVEGSPTKVDYQKKLVPLFQSSLLEDL